MIKETIYVAINQKDEIQWVRGSSKKTRYFKTDRYLKGAVEYHNKTCPNDIWKVRKCVILEDEPSDSEKPNNSTISKMEQVDKDINVRSKDEPQTHEIHTETHACVEDKQTETVQGTGDCEHCSRLFVDCDGR